MPGTGERPIDAERILAVFARHGVEFLIVGGLAAQLHGATRATYDVDVLAGRSAKNLERVAAALRELGAFLRVGGLSDEEARALPMPIDAATLAALEVSTWRTEAGDVDVLTNLRSLEGERRPYEDLLAAAVTAEIGSIQVRLAGLGDIVAAKKFANRGKDLEALPELERLRDEQADR